MKVIKRDGRAVDFDRDKIYIAIEKANTEVKGKEKATKQEIEEIIEYIEDIDKKRILVEDIQDIIEQKLMEIGKYNLAKKYIVYRYTRALVRKQNTTDESILGLIKRTNIEAGNIHTRNGNINASTQRNLIAGEVSKDLTRRILLPEKITKADNTNVIKFHDAEYFIQPIINSSYINIADMLENGTVINGKKIDSPKSFQVACILTTQIILAVASAQYGCQYIDISYLAKYLKNSTKMEFKNGIQTIIYQINTAITTRGTTPEVTLMLNEEQEKHIKECNLIKDEFKKQIEQGIKNENDVYEPIEYPKFITDLKDIKKNKEFKFDQGVVSVNLFQAITDAKNEENLFWKLLEDRTELCREALMYRHYALLGTYADISPIHWRHGGISRLQKGETIDKLLKNKNSTLTLGYIGLKETIAKISTEKEETKFEKNILKFLKDKTIKWTKESGLQFKLEQTT